MPINKQRPIIRYNNLALLRSDSPAFSEESNSGNNVDFLPLVQSLDFGFNVPESREQVISSRNVLNHFFKPGIEVDLNLNFIENFEDLFLEYFSEEGLIEDFDKDINLYAVFSEKIEDDAIIDGFDNFDMVSFGNCQLKSFSMSQAVNGPIESEYSFVAYNLKAERVSGENSVFSGELPCLDLTGDQTNEISGLAAKYNFSNLSEKYNNSAKRGSVFPSYNTNITISGINNVETFLIETDSIQDFNFNVDIQSKSIYTIGKKYPIKRKALFPSEGSFSFSNKISSFRVGQDESYQDFSAEKSLKDFLNKQIFYNIKIEMANFSGDLVTLEIPSGRLEGQSYSSSIGADLNCNLDFSFDLFAMNNSINCILTKPNAEKLLTKADEKIERKV